MPLTPDDWNVVVVGSWNRAILTPAWIAGKLFGLVEGTPVQVEVPIDMIGPIKVTHDGISVLPSKDRLVIQAASSNVESLHRAMVIGRQVLDELPRTPLRAAGFNLKYNSEDTVDAIGRITAHDWDNRLSDSDFVIEDRAIARSLQWNDGAIKVAVKHDMRGRSSIHMNFDRQTSDREQLKEWLNPTVDAVREKARAVFQTIGIPVEMIEHA